MLGLAGYVANQDQSDNVKQIMRFMMSWAPMITCFLGAFFMMLYPLNAARMKIITQELADRRAQQR